MLKGCSEGNVRPLKESRNFGVDWRGREGREGERSKNQRQRTALESESSNP